jgi:hypothetical protein
MRTKLRTLTFSVLIALILIPFAQARGQEAESTFYLRAAQYRLARLSATTASDEALFAVDQCGVVNVHVIATVDGIGTSVETPSGQVISPLNAADFGGSYGTVQGSDEPESPLLLPANSRGFHHIYSFPWQGAGVYKVHFQAPVGLAEEVPVFTEVMTDSPVRANLFVTDDMVAEGRPVVLAGALLDGQAPVAGANVSVYITPPAGPAVNLTLLDDGGAADGEAGDGLYSGEFTPAAAGTYSALAIITGTTSGGVSFRRETAAEFEVVNPPSRLTGTVQDQGVDDNFDGLLDRVTFDVGTQTTTAGRYRAYVHLKTASGKSIVGSSEADLPAGLGSLPVSIAAEDLRDAGEDGPYDIELVELDTAGDGGGLPCDRLDAAGRSQAYLLSQLQRKPLILTGVTTDQGVDDNGNGRFDRLLVTVQLDALYAGFYSWNMKLSDQAGRELSFSSDSGFLNSGLNNLTFSFDGSAIGSSGAHGPFRLSDLLLFGTKSIVVPDVGRTQVYRSIQFENGRGSDVTPPSLTVTLTPDTLWPANHRLAPVTADIRVSDDTDTSPTVTLVSITSSEPDNGLGDGDTPNDVQGAAFGTDDREFLLRAERSGRGGGRVYTVTYQARDAAGNTATVSARVRVPHDRSK